MRKRHCEIALVFEPGCKGSLSTWKLFSLTWTHLCVPLSQQYIFTEQPSETFCLTKCQPALPCSGTDLASGPSHPADGVLLCLQWRGMVLPRCQVGWDGYAPQDTQEDKVAPVVEVELSTNSHWSGSGLRIQDETRPFYCYFKCLTFPRRQQKKIINLTVFTVAKNCRKKRVKLYLLEAYLTQQGEIGTVLYSFTEKQK